MLVKYNKQTSDKFRVWYVEWALGVSDKYQTDISEKCETNITDKYQINISKKYIRQK